MTSTARHPADGRRRSSAPRAGALVAAAFVATSIATVGGPDTAGADADLAGALDGTLLDERATPDADTVADVTASEEYDFDGELIRVSDPAPVGPFLSDAVASKDDDAPQSAPSMAEAFSLHSRPTSDLKIFLDFDGHVTTNSLWNDSDHPVINSGPYSRESRPNNTFSSHELDGIEEIWERVSEDFAPWDVDVTTQDPGVAGLTRSSSTDPTYGIRVVISQDSAWYGPYGGAAYLRSFTRSTDLPAFVFSDNLAAGSPKSVAEAASHEVGHTLNLYHDAITNPDGSNTGYYSGHGNWAPIMGVGYSRDVTQWSKGEYANASNTEDDLAIIDGYLDRLPDLSGSTTLGGSDSVTTHTLVDGGATATHQLVVTEGPVSISVEKASPDGNLYADLTVRNAAGQAVAGDTPSVASAWALSATLSSDIAPGTYTIEVRSIGLGTASNGFTNYASIGEYALSIDVPDSTVTSTTTTTTTTTVPSGDTTSSTTTSTTVPGGDPTSSTSTTTTVPGGNGTTTVPTTTPPPAGEPTTVDGDRLSGITPQRLLDTRQPSSEFGRLRENDRIRLDPLRIDSVPSDASAVVINVAAITPSNTGFLSVTDCSRVDDDAPTSSLNFAAGRNVGNSIIAPLSDDGFICIDASAATDVLVDVTGWTGASGANALVSLDAWRAVDTRRGDDTRALAPDVRTVFALDGATGETLEASTDAVSINVTAVNPAANGFLTIDDCSASVATTSSLNFAARETRGNNGVFALGDDQSICVTSSVATHLTIDVTGQFAAGNGLTFVPATPTRLLDTRNEKELAAGASTGYVVPQLRAASGDDIAPAAASVNLASVRHPDSSFVTAWDCGSRPDTSALNTVAGAPTANSALVAITESGRSCLFHSAGGDLIVDLTGWWV